MGVPDISLREMDELVKGSSVPVLVDVWSPTCGPCRAIAPQIDRLAQQNADRLKVVKVNITTNPDIRNRYNLLGVPTILMFDGGKEVDRVVGGYPQKIDAMVQQRMAAQPAWTPPPPPVMGDPASAPSLALPIPPPSAIRRRNG